MWWHIDGATATAILYGNEEYITDVEFSPNAQYIASSSLSGNYTGLGWHDIRITLSIGRTSCVVLGQSNSVPDDRYLVSGSDDQTALLWDLDTGAIMRRFEAHQGTGI